MNKDKATEIRNEIVYQIGNTTLIKKSLNSTIKNYDFARKMLGNGPKNKGLKEYGELYVTKEVIDIFDKGRQWDEDEITIRTQRLTEEFLAIW